MKRFLKNILENNLTNWTFENMLITSVKDSADTESEHFENTNNFVSGFLFQFYGLKNQ